MSRTIYIDESGYSGSKFVDDEKPLFVVASLGIEPDEAERLKRAFFGTVAAAELKHSKLISRDRQRSMVLAFLSEIVARPGTAKVWLAEKRYAGWLKIVDYLVEPYLHARGQNIYRDGGNLALASMLHYCIPSSTSAEYSDALLTSTLKLLKSGATADRQLLVQRLQDGVAQYPPAAEFLHYVAVPLHSLPVDHFAGLPSDATDLAFGAALQLMAWWRTDTTEELRVVHDATSNMSRRKDIWDALTGPALDPHQARCASGLVVTYPIVAKTTFARSDCHAGLQLADVLAGALGCTLDLRHGGKRTEYAAAVLDRIGGMSLHALFPTTDIRPESMGTLGLDAEPTLEHLTNGYLSGKVPLPTSRGPRA